MGQGDAVKILQEALYTILTVTAPVLSIGLIVGIIVSVIQAATQVNEQSLGFISKILAIFIALIIFGPWMLSKLTDFTKMLYDYMGMVLR